MKQGNRQEVLRLLRYMRFLYQVYRVEQSGSDSKGIPHLIEGFKLRKGTRINQLIQEDQELQAVPSICVELRQAYGNYREMDFLEKEFGNFLKWLESKAQVKGNGVDYPKPGVAKKDP